MSPGIVNNTGTMNQKPSSVALYQSRQYSITSYRCVVVEGVDGISYRCVVVERVDTSADGGGRQQLGAQHQVPQLGGQQATGPITGELPSQPLAQLHQPPQLRYRQLTVQSTSADNTQIDATMFRNLLLTSV